MDIKTLESFKLSDAIFFHEELNKNLWDENNKLHPKVKNQLILIAKDFIDELGIKDLDVKDITISGSNAAYTYTKHSDLDLHILVDMSKLPNNEVYKELFTAKKNLYNDSHDITVHGVPVELYVQDSNEPVVSLGEYSILHDKWLKIPTKRRANFDQTITKQKYDKLLHIIKKALKSKDLEQIENIISTIKRYRKAGLDKGGEFGPENLAYKALRTQGYIDKLYNLKQLLHSRKLSIEDYDPNGPPPGPEFKPTMPAGTVRVDVSDVYDWYKLGQHISNMKGLGKHDFGKGPPSTVMSFGDEDLEHQYIKALQKTGLSTTDIDPFDPKQPKGIKRQKVDPTYNVNEKINPEILKKNFNKQKVIQTKKGPITLVATTPATQEEVFPQFYIKGYNSEGRLVAYLRLNIRDLEKFGFFGPKKDIKNAYLVAGNVSVYDEYQKLGIAREMYKFAQELGNDIKPSDTQTSAGKAMWSSFKRNAALAEDKDYMYGHCHVMALALKKLHPDWKIRAHIGWGEDSEDDDDYRVDHVYIVAPDGSAYDCRGRFDNEQELVGPDETGGVETQFVDYTTNDIKNDIQRGELKSFTRQDLENAIKFAGNLLSEDQTMMFAAEKTPAVNPYGGLKDRQFRGAISEMPDTSGPVGVQPGGWRTYRPKVDEGFDQPYPLKWTKSDYGDYDALAKLSDGTNLSIMFNNEYKKNWMVEFYRNNSQAVTGEGDAQRIFATVLHAIQQFIKKKKPVSLFFSAVKEDDPTGSRTKLYNRLVQRYATSLGYNLQTQEHPDQMSYKLTKIDNVKEGSKQFNKCFDKACQLYDKALEKDLNPVLYQVADYQGSAENADNKWLKLPKQVWSHYVTVIGDTVYDPTATQFGPEKETKYSLDKLKTEWGKIYKIRPRELEESASGYIPSNAEKDDPRFKTALTVDIKPDTMKKDAKKFGNKISRAGIPPTLNPSGKF